MGYLYGRQEKNQKAGRGKMRSEWIKKAAAALLAALLLELIPCQFSFWTTVTKKAEDLTARAEILTEYTAMEELELLEPFGTGNPKPVFAQKDLKFVSARALGKAGNVLRFTVEDSEQKRWEMMYFGGKDNFEAYAAEKYGQTALDGLYSGKGSPLYFDVVYYPGVNTWQGNTKLQLVMQQYR